jgi:hypothetical protein
MLQKNLKKWTPPASGVPDRPWIEASTLAQYIFFLCLPFPPGHTYGSPIYGGYQPAHRWGGEGGVDCLTWNPVKTPGYCLFGILMLTFLVTNIVCCT